MKLSAFVLMIISVCSIAAVATALPKVEWELEGCDIVKEDLKIKPAELFKSYVEKDIAGEFLQTSEWLNQAILCPGFMGGPDTYDVISKYTIKDLKHNRFQVKYDVEGTVSSKMIDGKPVSVFTPKTLDVTETTEAIKSPWGYKLSAPWGNSKVDAGVALARAKKMNQPFDREADRALTQIPSVLAAQAPKK